MKASKFPPWLVGAAYCAACALIGVTAGLAVLSALNDAGDIVERRQALEAMPASEQTQLVSRQFRFERLDEARRERLRRLQAELDEAEDEEDLRSVMHQYYQWLGTLQALDQAELLELASDMEKRIERVKDLQTQQRRWRPFSDTDVVFAAAWLEQRLKPKLTPQEQERLDQVTIPQHHWLELVRMAQAKWGGWPGPPPADLDVTEKDLTSLFDGLGPIARHHVQELRERMKFPPQEATARTAQLVLGILANAVLRQSMRYDLQQSEVTKEDLLRFFRSQLDEKFKENVARSPWIRDFLIQYYYLHDKFPERYPAAMPSSFGPGRGGPGGRWGPGGGGPGGGGGQGGEAQPGGPGRRPQGGPPREGGNRNDLL